MELQIKLELERAIVEETEEITYKDGTEEMEDREVVKNNFHVQSFKSISVEDLKIENPWLVIATIRANFLVNE